jgi:hypothetical protein
MPTSAPTRIAIGDIRSVDLVGYSSQIIAICRLATERLTLHYDGTPDDELMYLPFLGPKGIITGAVVGDLLHLMWDGVGQNITYARWNLATDEVALAAAIVFPGTVPSLQAYLGGGLLAHFINPTSGDHVARRSTDGGTTWSAETLINARLINGPVEHVDVSVSPFTPTNATWANSKPDT